MTRPAVLPCSIFGGRSPKTGKRVGERHRWDGGAWGKGHCEFCGRSLEQVLEKPKIESGSAKHLARALKSGE